MKTKIVSLVAVVALLAFGLQAFLGSRKSTDPARQQTGEIQWHSFNEGVALAKQDKKKILIDVYTDWCTWCKKMDSDVYTDDAVAKAISSDFVGVKLNAESANPISYNGDQTDERTFAQSVGVSGYPTTVFLDPGGQPITKIEGFVQAKEFTTVLNYIGKDHYKNESFEKFKSNLE